jgi:hypothetical protein
MTLSAPAAPSAMKSGLTARTVMICLSRVVFRTIVLDSPSSNTDIGRARGRAGRRHQVRRQIARPAHCLSAGPGRGKPVEVRTARLALRAVAQLGVTIWQDPMAVQWRRCLRADELVCIIT